jgi:hypothetical protein
MTSILVSSDFASALPRAGATLRRMTRSAYAPATLVFLVYGVWLLAMLGSGHDARDFIHMGRRYVFAPHTVPLIKPDPKYQYSTTSDGYDGQFAYYIAVAPVDARLHLDRVNYRYTRIVYPMTARLLSLGHAELVPYALIVINWFAIPAGTYIIALWLRRRGISPWFALVYGLSPGLFVCLQRDLEEPLAYALVALAIFVYSSQEFPTRSGEANQAKGTQPDGRAVDDHGGVGGTARRPFPTSRLVDIGRYLGRGSAHLVPREHRRALGSGIVFAVAVLTRESMAIFPLVLALASCFAIGSAVPAARRDRLRGAAFLLVPALLPFLLYKAFLLYWLSSNTDAIPPALLPRFVPFSGLISYYPWRNHQVEVIIGVVAPSLICAAMGVWAIWKRRASPEVWLLLANVLVFVVMLNRLSYENIYAAGRIATGVMLTALLCIPTFDPLTGRDRLWLSISALLWILPWPILASFVEEVPLTRALLLELAIALVLWAVAEGGWRAVHTITALRSQAP